MSILGASLNLVIFASIITFSDGWGHVFTNPVIPAFLTIVSAFCIAECWEGSKQIEVIVCNTKTWLEVALAGLTGGVLFMVFAISLGEHLNTATGLDIGSRLAGASIACIGIFLRVAAFRELGRAFVSMPRVVVGQRLVVKGPYGFLRHPSETGIICISLGIAWMMNSSLGLLITASLLLPLSYSRVTREERVLTKNFNQAYLDYQDSVPRLIPALPYWRCWKRKFR